MAGSVAEIGSFDNNNRKQIRGASLKAEWQPAGKLELSPPLFCRLCASRPSATYGTGGKPNAVNVLAS